MKTPPELTHFFSNNLAPLIGPGAGLINATNFIDTTSYFQYTTLDFGIRPSPSSVVFKLYNDGPSTRNYTISHIAAPTVLTKYGLHGSPLDSLPLLNETAEIILYNKSIEIPPGESGSIRAYVSFPYYDGLKYTVVFQGKIQAESSDGQKVSIPYTATLTDAFEVWNEDYHPLLYYNMKNQLALDFEPYYPGKKLKTDSSSSELIPSFKTSEIPYLYIPTLIGAKTLQYLLVNESFTEDRMDWPLTNKSRGVVTAGPNLKTINVPRSQSGFYLPLDFSEVKSGNYRLLALSIPAVTPIALDVTSMPNWHMYISEAFNYQSEPVPDYNIKSPYKESDYIYLSEGSIISTATNSSSKISPYDILAVSIPFKSVYGFRPGYNISVKLPQQLTDFPSNFKVHNAHGRAILNVTINDNTLTATAIANAGVYLASGSLTFKAKLRNPSQYLGKSVTQLPLVFESSSYLLGYYPQTLNISPYHSNVPSLGEIYDSGTRAACIYIPSGFTARNNLSIDIKASGFNISCSNIYTYADRNLSQPLTDLTKATNYAVSCNGDAARELNIKIERPELGYEGALVTLPLNLPANKDVSTFGQVDVTLNGTLFKQSFEYKLTRKIIGDNVVLYPEPITGDAHDKYD